MENIIFTVDDIRGSSGDVRRDFLGPPYDTTQAVVIAIKAQPRPLKSCELIKEKQNGPNRGFGYLSLFSDNIDLTIWSQRQLLLLCKFQQESRHKDHHNPNGAKLLKDGVRKGILTDNNFLISQKSLAVFFCIFYYLVEKVVTHLAKFQASLIICALFTDGMT